MSRLDDIKARAEAAIKGPWRWWGNTASDQVYLGTTHSGRLILLSPELRRTEYVFDHDACETYTLEEARENVIRWCGTHEDPDPTFREDLCKCDEIREFLRGELESEEGHRHLDRPLLSRGVQVRSDLRFPVDGVMRSYRNFARYEVLGRKLAAHWSDYRSAAEWEAEGGVVGGERPRNDGRTLKEALYREDFMGLDHPEATFIERSRDDVDYLIERLEAAETAVEAYKRYAVAAMHHQQAQETADAAMAAASAWIDWRTVADGGE